MLRVFSGLFSSATDAAQKQQGNQPHHVTYDIAEQCFTQHPTRLKTEALCINPQQAFTDLQSVVKELQHADLELKAQDEINRCIAEAEQCYAKGDATGARQVIDDCRLRIGQLIVVADFRSEQAGAKPDWGRITELYKGFVTQQAEHIDSMQGYAEQLGLEDASMIRQIQLSRLFADLCISKAGLLNLGLIEDLNQRFLQDDSYAWQRDMIRAMRSLVQQPDLRHYFYQLEKVDWKKSPEALRALIMMVKAPLATRLASDRDARRLLFMTYITRLRQGPVGSCFADAVGISAQLEAQHQYLRDLVQLISCGGLVRSIDGQMERFKPTLTIADQSLDTLLTVQGDELSREPDGQRVKIWQVQGLVEAAKLLRIGAGDLAKYLDGLNGKQISIAELLARMATEAQNAKMLPLCKITFTAQTQNVLLRMWENSLADLAEAKKSDFFRSALLGSVRQGFEPALSDLAKLFPQAVSTLWPLFESALNQRIDLRYDQSLPAADGQSESHVGGFVLVDRVSDARVENPEAFRDFLLKALGVAQAEKIDEKIQEAAEVVFTRLSYELHDTDQHVLRRCFAAFSAVNKGGDPLANWKELQQSPLWSKTGDYSSAIWEVYLSALGPIPEQHTAPQNARELLLWSIRQVRQLFAQKPELRSQGGDFALPARIQGVHSFRMLPLREPFLSFVTMNEADPEPMMAAKFDAATAQVSQCLLDSERVKKIQHALAPYVHEMPPAPTSKQATVQRYGQQLVSWLCEHGKEQRALAEAIVLGVIFEALSPEQMLPLKNSVVKVFDTNWQRDNQNLYFCFFKDPITDKVILGVCNEDLSVINSRNLPPFINGVWQISDCPFTLEEEKK